MSVGEPYGGVYRLARFVLRIGLELFFRFEAFGAEHLPAEGGCIVASNHASYLDSCMVGCGLRQRVVRFLARDTLPKSRLGAWLFRNLLVVLIDRTRGDIAGLRRALDVLSAGGVLGVFPEGTRTLDGNLQPAKGGIGFLIAKAGVPVVPVFVDGTYHVLPKARKWPRPGKVRVFYGKPILPEELQSFGKDRQSYEQVGQLVMSRIAELRRQVGEMPPSA